MATAKNDHKCRYRDALEEVVALFGVPRGQTITIRGSDEVVTGGWPPEQDQAQLLQEIQTVARRALAMP